MKRGNFYGIVALLGASFILLYWRLLTGLDIYTHDSIVWYGSFHYFIESLSNWSFPFWDPYTLTGTPFYPTIHTHGMLDPVSFLALLMVKILKTSILTSFNYFYLFRLIVFIAGAYFLFKVISRSYLAALLSTGVLLFAITPSIFRQMGILQNVFLAPFSMYFLIKTLEHADTKTRYAYLAGLALTIGVALNVFIPAYFLFNLFAFTIVIVITGCVKIDRFKVVFQGRRAILYSLGIFVMLVFMAAPAFTLFRESKSPENEHFPSVRIIQKNNNIFKQIEASQVPDDVLSAKFTNFKGVYAGVGNLLSLAYPDLWKYYLLNHDMSRLKSTRFGGDFVSEAFIYIGIIPFLVALVGLLYSKSRYRWVGALMLVLITVNMVCWSGVHNRAPNLIQRAFNVIFPPLKMMEVREVLSGYFLLYMCLLLSLGISLAPSAEKIRSLVDAKWRSLIYLTGGVVVTKVLITFYYFKTAVFISTHDLVAIFIIAGMGVMVYLLKRRVIAVGLFGVAMVVVSSVDLASYNRAIRRQVLMKNELGAVIETRGKSIEDAKLSDKGQGFDFFRIPFIRFSGMSLAFSESIFKVKGAMSRGNNHHFLTTKRFYDYFTHIPLRTQFALSGMSSRPVIGFYPTGPTGLVKSFDDRRSLLSYMATREAPVLEQTLHIEPRWREYAAPAAKSTEFKGLGQFPDAPWLDQNNIANEYALYSSENESRITQARAEVNEELHNADADIDVTGFTSNSLTLKITNNVDGYLYYNDGWSRHWRAYDNGRETAIVPANYNFKAVYLEKGGHTLSFVYDPKSYRYAVIMYYIGLAAALAVMSLCTFARGPRRARPDNTV